MSSIILNFNICESSNCDQLVFTDTTGSYSSTNTSGYGSPNDDISSVTATTLTITDPTGIITVINLFTLSPSFPTTDSTQEYIISPSNIGSLNTKFTDGIYIFIYSVTTVVNGVTTIYTQTVQKLFYCQAKCCIQSLFTAIDDFDCDCNQSQIEEAYQGDILLRLLQRASGCGSTSRFTEALTLIQSLCNTSSTCTECN